MRLSGFNLALMGLVLGAASQAARAEDCLKSLLASIGYEGGVRETALPVSMDCTTGESKVDWISVTITPPGTVSGSLRYYVKPNLKPAMRRGSITIGGQTLTVTQERAPAGGIAGSPSPLVFRLPSTDPDPEKRKQTLTLKVWGGEEFPYTASVAEADQHWIRVGAAKSANGVAQVPVSVDASGLKPNVYTAHISVNAPGATNSPLKFTVNLTVDP